MTLATMIPCSDLLSSVLINFTGLSVTFRFYRIIPDDDKRLRFKADTNWRIHTSSQ